ncbi:MAG: hypothetical protein M1296_01290 [Chloroflexi bacterium]|nr:hypothetical protein [Chloroflexota bacterium]
MELLHPRIEAHLPAFVAGSLHAYEDILGVFSGLITVRPAIQSPPLNTVVITSERLLACDTHGSTHIIAAVRLLDVTKVSTHEDAEQGYVSCFSELCDLHVSELRAEDAAFLQDVIYRAAAGVLFRVTAAEEAPF